MQKLLLTISCILVLHLQVFSQSTTIKGKVTDKPTGEGLPGVSIVVKGTSNGTITDFDGNYSLAVENAANQSFDLFFYRIYASRDQNWIEHSN